MAKKKQRLVKIEFIGTDLVLDNVRCVIAGNRKTLPFTHIDYSGDQWLLINGNGGIVDIPTDVPVVIQIVRDVDKITLETGSDYSDILTRATRLSLGKVRLFHLDCINADINQFREWRLSYTREFITDTRSIQAIRLTPLE